MSARELPGWVHMSSGKVRDIYIPEGTRLLKGSKVPKASELTKSPDLTQGGDALDSQGAPGSQTGLGGPATSGSQSAPDRLLLC